MSKIIKIGVVLSSGGGRDVYSHIGFLLALENLGVDIKTFTRKCRLDTHIFGLALLAGIGFTMSLFINPQAFVDVVLLANALCYYYRLTYLGCCWAVRVVPKLR